MVKWLSLRLQCKENCTVSSGPNSGDLFRFADEVGGFKRKVKTEPPVCLDSLR